MVTNTNKTNKLLYPELSYKIQGCLFNVRNTYGPGHKESLYCNALEEVFNEKQILFEREK